MKKIILTLIALAIFMVCASLGYQLAFATSIDKGLQTLSPGGLLSPTKTADPDQSCVLIIQVDRLDVRRPRLVSAWAALLYFPREGTPKISLPPVYILGMQSKEAQALERSFSLNDQGQPDSAFWKAFHAYNIDYCKDYVLVDEYAVVQALNWAENRSDMSAELQKAAGNQAQMKGILDHACTQIVGLAERPELPHFDFHSLAPDHMRMNLVYTTAASYWDRTIHAPAAGTCQ